MCEDLDVDSTYSILNALFMPSSNLLALLDSQESSKGFWQLIRPSTGHDSAPSDEEWSHGHAECAAGAF